MANTRFFYVGKVDGPESAPGQIPFGELHFDNESGSLFFVRWAHRLAPSSGREKTREFDGIDTIQIVEFPCDRAPLDFYLRGKYPLEALGPYLRNFSSAEKDLMRDVRKFLEDRLCVVRENRVKNYSTHHLLSLSA